MKLLFASVIACLILSSFANAEDRYCPTIHKSTPAKFEVWSGSKLLCSKDYDVSVFERKDTEACIPRPVYININYTCQLAAGESLVLSAVTFLKIDQRTSKIGSDVVTDVGFRYENSNASLNQEGWMELWNQNTDSTVFDGEKTLNAGLRIKVYSIAK